MHASSALRRIGRIDVHGFDAAIPALDAATTDRSAQAGQGYTQLGQCSCHLCLRMLCSLHRHLLHGMRHPVPIYDAMLIKVSGALEY